MTYGMILLLLLAAVVAAGVSYFQYLYKNQTRSKITLILALLRFMAILGLLFLLINPIISRTRYETVKIPLPVVCDNSSSVSFLKADGVAREVFEKITGNKNLQEKFDLQPFLFDGDFKSSAQLTFNGKRSKTDLVPQNLKSIYKNNKGPIVLLTDGNQTHGTDYLYSFPESNAVYSIILGDTTKFLDLNISRLNVNKYAFLKNQFPAEFFLQYNGSKPVSAEFIVQKGNSTLAKQTVNFSGQNRSQVVNILLPASEVGLQVFKASLRCKLPERNLFNNNRNFAVEVIDQKTEIGVVTAANHPDIGAIKRAILSNAQRQVTVLNPSNYNDISTFNVLVLYQPDATFKKLISEAKSSNINSWVITGMVTDFNILSDLTDDAAFRMSSQKEDYSAAFNSNFNYFAFDDIGFDNLPPLDHPFGVITTKPNVIPLLQAKIRNIDANQPLMAFSEMGSGRQAFLFGENIWKWRLQVYAQHKSFEKFDQLLDKIIQYLASNQKRNSLVVDAEAFYNTGDPIQINAQFFNKNFEFDEKAKLAISVTNRDTKSTKSFDMIRGSSNYRVNLDQLAPGKYNYTVKEGNTKTSVSGYFEIIDFDIEKQFTNPDLTKLNQLAERTKGQTYMPNQVDLLIDNLLKSDNYKPVEKAVTTRSPIIEWEILLVLIAVILSAEWFIRKYHGML
jgi:hypothetical protein